MFSCSWVVRSQLAILLVPAVLACGVAAAAQQEDRATQAVAIARQRVERFEKLFARNAVTEAQLAEAKIQLLDAEIDLAERSDDGQTTTDRLRALVALQETEYRRARALHDKQVLGRIELSHRWHQLVFAKVRRARWEQNYGEAIRSLTELLAYDQQTLAIYKQLREKNAVTDRDVQVVQSWVWTVENRLIALNALAEEKDLESDK